MGKLKREVEKAKVIFVLLGLPFSNNLETSTIHLLNGVSVQS